MSYVSALANVTIDLVGEQFAGNFASYQDGVYTPKMPGDKSVTRAEFRETIGGGLGGKPEQIEGLGEFMSALVPDGPTLEPLAAGLSKDQIIDLDPGLLASTPPKDPLFCPCFFTLLDKALINSGELEDQPTRDQEIAAAILLRAAIRAGKHDNQLSEEKRSRILEGLTGSETPQRDFVLREFDTPDDLSSATVWCPEGFAPYVYVVSLVAVDFHSDGGQEYTNFNSLFRNLPEDLRTKIDRKFGNPL